MAQTQDKIPTYKEWKKKNPKKDYNDYKVTFKFDEIRGDSIPNAYREVPSDTTKVKPKKFKKGGFTLEPPIARI